MLRLFTSVFFALALLAPLAAGLCPADGDDVAVFAGPAQDRGAAGMVAASDGNLIGGRAWAVIARAGGPDFTSRLYAAGALLVVRAAPALCAPTRSRAT